MNIRLPTREEIYTAFAQGEEVVVELFVGMGKQIKALAEQLEKQAAALKALQARLEKHSRNSSEPPSSDGYIERFPVHGIPGRLTTHCSW